MRDWQAYVRSRLDLSGLAPERESRIVRELAAQLDDCYRDALGRGASDEAAAAHAAAQVTDWRRMADDVRRADRQHAKPGVERLADTIQDSRHAGGARRAGAALMLANAIRDARHAIRQLRKSPAFTAVAVLTLAVGIGANSAIFTVVNSVLLQPLPYPGPQALVRVHEVVPQYGRFSVAPATFLDWRRRNTVFERLAAYTSGSGTLLEGDGPERIQGALVSWDLFDLLRVAPAIGSGFTAAQDLPRADGVIVISHGLWQRRFGGDRGVVGRTVNFNGAPVRIAGVMPAHFSFPARTAEFWRPIAIDPANASRGAHFLGVVARLKPDVPIDRAAVEMKTIAERLAREYPDSSANESAEVVALHDQVVGPVRPALLTLLAAVGAVVLIACANVANLLLVRASVREREVAIRAALGAGRRRLALQMVTESLVLALAGGALGVGLAYLAIPIVQTLGASSIPRVAEIALDRRVLAFAFGASLLTGVLFGLAPAWHAARAGLGAVLKEGGRSSATSSGRWVRNGLLVVEVALSIVLLVGATLLVRSFEKLTGVDPGFDPDHVLAFQVALPVATYPQDGNRLQFFDTLLERLQSVPDVRSASLCQRLPLRGGYVLSFAIQGRPPAKPGEEPSANYRTISASYFDTLGIPLLRGRAFTARDTEKPPMVAIVDDAFVKRFFPDENPLGRGIDIGNGTDGFYEIVGVVGDVTHERLDAAPAPTMYVPFKQDVFSTVWVMARGDSDPNRLAPAARQVVRDIDRTLPAYAMTPLATVLDESVADRRFSMLLLGAFALVAMFLAAVGLYGVVGYTVSQRTREIGLRMAIGAQPGDVLRMVVGGGMKLVLVGVAIGLAAAIGLAQLVETMLFGVTPSDPASYAVTSIVLLVVAAAASYVPARRAMRVDPLVALQSQ
jgi:putative ABC transport system permease protein